MHVDSICMEGGVWLQVRWEVVGYFSPFKSPSICALRIVMNTINYIVYTHIFEPCYILCTCTFITDNMCMLLDI